MPRLPRIEARAAILVGVYLALWTAATLYLAAVDVLPNMHDFVRTRAV